MIKTCSQWNDLHSAALAKINREWIRLREFTDRPEVCRDLIEFGFIEVKTEKVSNYNVCFYRLKGGLIMANLTADLAEYADHCMCTGSPQVFDLIHRAIENIVILEEEVEAYKSICSGEIKSQMKADCVGEFWFKEEVWNEEKQDYVIKKTTIDWVTCKEIYKKMLESALKSNVLEAKHENI